MILEARLGKDHVVKPGCRQREHGWSIIQSAPPPCQQNRAGEDGDDDSGKDSTDSPAKVCNEDIARAFEEVADLLDLENDNPFRIRAYRNAARTPRGASLAAAARTTCLALERI